MHLYRPLCLCLVLAVNAWTQSKPNFSGTWKLNVAQSDYSDKRATVPDRLTWIIQQNGDHVKYRVDWEKGGKKERFDAEVRIGGNTFESDAAGIISMEWKQNALAVNTLYNPGSDRESSREEIWTLSEDGKKLIDQMVYHLPAKQPGEVQVRRVFEKQ